MCVSFMFGMMNRASNSASLEQSSTFSVEKNTWHALWENICHFVAILLSLLVSLINSLISVQEIPEINPAQKTATSPNQNTVRTEQKSIHPEEKTGRKLEEEYDDASCEVPSAGNVARFQQERMKKPGRSKVITLKNLPWDLKKEDLIKVLNTLDAKPADVYYLNNANGKFTGMASVKYPSPDHANVALPALNKLVLSGRPVNAEFRNRKRDKKKKQEKETEQLYASSPKITARRKSSATSYPNSALKLTNVHKPQPEIVVTPGGTRRRSSSVSLVRQPCGPDGTKGFSNDYQKQRDEIMRRFSIA